MNTQYVHQQLGKDVESFAGYYTTLEENRLPYNGKEVLYVVGQATVESSCCGKGSFRYAQVPGYVVSWKERKSETGMPITTVEPIQDDDVREYIRQALEEKYATLQIEFW